MSAAADLLMTGAEVKTIAGGYTQPAKQLDELRRQGFWRARRSRLTGEVILERAHYDAVCAGRDKPANHFGETEPQLRPA